LPRRSPGDSVARRPVQLNRGRHAPLRALGTYLAFTAASTAEAGLFGALVIGIAITLAFPALTRSIGASLARSEGLVQEPGRA
jgi:hypothetical protein